MSTPGWVRKHRQRERAVTTAARAELHLQALERIEKEEAAAAEKWIPRRGMRFASEG